MSPEIEPVDDFLCRHCSRLAPSTSERCPRCGRENPFGVAEEPAQAEATAGPSDPGTGQAVCRSCFEFIPASSSSCPICRKDKPFGEPFDAKDVRKIGQQQAEQMKTAMMPVQLLLVAMTAAFIAFLILVGLPVLKDFMTLFRPGR